MTSEQALLDQVYDAGGRLKFSAPDDDAAYAGYHADVETLLSLELQGYLECKPMRDHMRGHRTYLLVVAVLTDAGRELVDRRRAGSGGA